MVAPRQQAAATAVHHDNKRVRLSDGGEIEAAKTSKNTPSAINGNAAKNRSPALVTHNNVPARNADNPGSNGLNKLGLPLSFICGLTPELSRPARCGPGRSETAKRARLERIVRPHAQKLGHRCLRGREVEVNKSVDMYAKRCTMILPGRCPVMREVQMKLYE